MKKGHVISSLLIIMAVPIVLCIMLASFSSAVVYLNLERTIPLEDGWRYDWENSDQTLEIQLPAHIRSDRNSGTLHLQNTLPVKTFKNACLFMRTSQQYIKVYLNDSLIYQYTKNPNNQGKSPGSSYHFINLPNSYMGGTLDIYLTSPYTQYKGVVNEIKVGSSIAHVLDILSTHSLKLIISAVVAVSGLILIFFFLALFIFGSRYINILHLGLFAFFSGLWMISESRAIEIFIQNPIFLLNVAFISQFLMPITILAFILKTYQPRNSIWLKASLWFFTCFFIVSCLLHLTRIVEFLDILLIFHFFVFLCVTMLIITSLNEIISGNKSIKLFFIGCIIQCVFALADIGKFYFSEIPWLNAQSFFQFGMLAFVMITIASLAQNLFNIRDKQISHDLLLSLAYTDILTGFKNRTAFEERIAELNTKLDAYSSIHFIILDINGLKCVNDNLGHKEGDRLLVEGSRLINETLGILGELFRIGGDEFVIIITDMEPYFIHIEIDTLNQRIQRYNESQNRFVVSIAYGIDSYTKDIDKDLHSVFVRADKAMYICKENQKAKKINVL